MGWRCLPGGCGAGGAPALFLARCEALALEKELFLDRHDASDSASSSPLAEGRLEEIDDRTRRRALVADLVGLDGNDDIPEGPQIK